MFTIRKTYILLNDRRFSLFLLAIFVIAGCVLGVFTARTVDPYFLSLMRQAACLPVSIVDLLFTILFPFVITSVISYISKPILLLPVCFLRALLYSYLLVSICIIYADSGWLVGGMLLFTDSVGMFLLFRYSLRYLSGFQNSSGGDIILSALIVSLTAVLDVCVVSPYLSVIMKS